MQRILESTSKKCFKYQANVVRLVKVMNMNDAGFVWHSLKNVLASNVDIGENPLKGEVRGNDDGNGLRMEILNKI